MITIKPFRAYRPRPDLTEAIAALPYDVYSSAEARAEVLRNPDSFLKVDRAETALPEGTRWDAPEVYETAGKLLHGMTAEGRLVQDDLPCLYLYELTMDGRVQTGVVGLASVDEYLAGTIKKHENTRTEKENDRVRHVDACAAHTGPIYLAFCSEPHLKALIAEAKAGAPVFDFTAADGIRHRGWAVSDPDAVAALAAAFAKLPAAYIADGHHRAASAARVALQRREKHPDYTGNEEFNYFLSVFFPDDELRILDYNRLVKDLNGHTEAEFLGLLEKTFAVTPLTAARSPQQKGSFTMCLAGRWYALTFLKQPQTDDPVAALDVSLLQDFILTPLLGIGDARTDPRIAFAGGIRGLGELEKRVGTDMAAAFAMYPTSIGELFAVADAGRLMPPKSTWFEPKLRSGLFIHSIEP